MKTKEARQVIEQALNQAFLKGAFSLQDAVMISEALINIYSDPEIELVKEN